MKAAPIDVAVQAAITELHRQGEAKGITTEDNGAFAQIDGSFEIEPLVRAVIEAIRIPSPAMMDAAREEAWAAGTSIRQHEIEGIHGAMIGVLLEERP